jgi:hypothetical protein
VSAVARCPARSEKLRKAGLNAAELFERQFAGNRTGPKNRCTITTFCRLPPGSVSISVAGSLGRNATYRPSTSGNLFRAYPDEYRRVHHQPARKIRQQESNGWLRECGSRPSSDCFRLSNRSSALFRVPTHADGALQLLESGISVIPTGQIVSRTLMADYVEFRQHTSVPTQGRLRGFACGST